MSIINTIDVVLLTLTGHRGSQQLSVALLKREHGPFEGQLALPGGFLHPEEDQDAQAAAERTLLAKTGVESPYLEQLGVWSGPHRDPRGWSLSVVYFALVPEFVFQTAAPAKFELVEVTRVRSLPFDHKSILDAAVTRIRNKSAYSTLPAHFCASEFTLSELQAVYEAVLGEPVNKVSFLRRLKEMNALEEVSGVKRSEGGRPAQIYRLRKAAGQPLTVLDRGLGKSKG